MAKARSSDDNEVLEIVNFIKDRMATKDDIATIATKEDILRVEERLLSIEQELKDIKRRLTALEDAFEKHQKISRQEIDDLWKHVADLEKRLNMGRS